MDLCKSSAATFLEKEIKTYAALALFLSKMGIKEHARGGKKRVPISPSYYKERMKEAKKMLHELRESN